MSLETVQNKNWPFSFQISSDEEAPEENLPAEESDNLFQLSH